MKPQRLIVLDGEEKAIGVAARLGRGKTRTTPSDDLSYPALETRLSLRRWGEVALS